MARTPSSVTAGAGALRMLATAEGYVAIWVQGVPATGGHALESAVGDRSGRFRAVVGTESACWSSARRT